MIDLFVNLGILQDLGHAVISNTELIDRYRAKNVHVADRGILGRGIEVVRKIWQRSKNTCEPAVVVVDVSPE